MRRRRLGRTGLDVSEVVFGAGFVGGLMVLKDDATRARALRVAIEGGINWVDTAPRYGDGRSESALGALLPTLRTQPFLSTKVSVDTRAPEDIATQIRRSVDDSLQRLRRPRVDLLQLHNRIGSAKGASPVGAVSVDDVLGPNGIADQLDRIRDLGQAGCIGLTALGDTTSIVEVIDSGRFDTAQVYYNLLNPSAARRMPGAWSGHDFHGVMAACQRHDVGMLGVRIFASGVLATDTRSGREVALTDDSDLDREAQRAHMAYAALGARAESRAQTALRFGLANEALSGVIVGLAEIAHLEEALDAARAGPMTEADIARLERVYNAGFTGA